MGVGAGAERGAAQHGAAGDGGGVGGPAGFVIGAQAEFGVDDGLAQLREGVGSGGGAEPECQQVFRITEGIVDLPKALLELFTVTFVERVLPPIDTIEDIGGASFTAPDGLGVIAIRGGEIGGHDVVIVPAEARPLAVGTKPVVLVLFGVVPDAHPFEQGHGGEGGFHIIVHVEPCLDIGAVGIGQGRAAPRVAAGGPHAFVHGGHRAGTLPWVVLEREHPFISLVFGPTGIGEDGRHIAGEVGSFLILAGFVAVAGVFVEFASRLTHGIGLGLITELVVLGQHFIGVFALFEPDGNGLAVKIPRHEAGSGSRQADQAVEPGGFIELLAVAGDEPCGLLLERLVLREVEFDGTQRPRIFLPIIAAAVDTHVDVVEHALVGKHRRHRAVPQRVGRWHPWD